MLKERDIAILRELAEKYISFASLPTQATTKERWSALNSDKMQKPMVLINQMPWNELTEDSLVCMIEDRYWRGVENNLRQKIYQWEHLPVDMLLPPYVAIPRAISIKEPGGNYGLVFQNERRGGENGSVSSKQIIDILETEEDLGKIRPATVLWNQGQDKLHLEQAEKIFDGIAPVLMSGVRQHLGLWDTVSFAKGVTNCYMDLYDRPEFLHSIMRRLTDCALALTRQYDEMKLFDATSMTCHCSVTYGSGLPTGTDTVGAKDAWAFGMAQLFSSTSPDITEEFELPYMQELFANFGAVYYGCCERLDDRLELIDQLPNVRKVSCSPWSDRDAFAEKLNKKYIMSNKPNPALLAAPDFDEALIRDDLRRTMRAAREHGVALEMILKDISTVKNDPSRLWRWAQIAAEETANF